jgi:predicted Rossmann fold nucleotide-binding protein DprA/Smf involved in DNA uptake
VIEELEPQLAGMEPSPGAPDSADNGEKRATASESASRPMPTLASSINEESTDVKTLLQCLKDVDKLHVDSIIELSGLKAQTVLTLLMDLELRGLIAQHPDKLFSLS